MSKRTHQRKVFTIVTAALFIAVLLGAIVAGTAAGILYNDGNSETGMLVLSAGIGLAILSIATGWVLFYRVGGLIADRRRAKVK